MTVNLGQMCDDIRKLDVKVSSMQAKLDALKDVRREQEEVLLVTMRELGTTSIKGKKSSATISETVRPQIKDAEKFFAFVLRRKALHLFERRVAVTEYRELKESLGGKPIPGLGEYTQIRLNVTKV